MTEVTVPDGIEPIRAYRGWKVNEWRGLTRLQSFTQDVDWPTDGPLSAACHRSDSWVPMYSGSTFWAQATITVTGSSTNPAPLTEEQRRKAYEAFRKKYLPHPDPPEESCACGIWGVADPWKIKPYDNWGSTETLVGVVEMWGRVVVGSEGWRAQYARPVAFISAPKFPNRGWFTRRKVTRKEDRASEAYGIPILDYWPAISPLEA